MATTRTLAYSTSDANTLSEMQEHTDFSLDYLKTRIADFLAKSSNRKLCICLAGGGGNFVSTLAASSGASAVLLDGTVAYHPRSFQQYVKDNNSDNKLSDDMFQSDTFRYCSQQAATIAAQAALNKAKSIQASDDQSSSSSRSSGTLMGIGCASALSTNTVSSTSALHTKKGGRAHVVIMTSKESSVSDHVYMSLRLSPDTHSSRWDQDIALSHYILSFIQYVTIIDTQSDSVHDMTTNSGDEVIIESLEKHSSSGYDIVKDAANLVTSGKESRVALELTKSYSGDQKYSLVSSFNIKPLSIIFPGSFNPPHQGHIALVNAAIRTVTDRNADFIKESGIFPSVLFELALTNADKPCLESSQVVERLQYFRDLSDEITDMPKLWRVLLTNAPLFSEKVDLLYPALDRSQIDDSEYFTDKNSPVLYWVIGTDTLVRILNPKYYSKSRDNMLDFLYSLPSDCQWIVGGRQMSGEEYQSGREALDDLPDDLQQKFILLQDFRVDISSTEIRQRKRLEKEKNRSG